MSERKVTSSMNGEVALSIIPPPATSSMNGEVALSIIPPPATSSPPNLTNPRTASGSSRENFLRFGLPLYQNALQGYWPAAEQILKQSPEWIRTSIGNGGERVLHIAAAAKHTHFVRELVKLMDSEDLEIRNEVNNTALCMAATSGVVEIAQLMVEMNVTLPNVRGSQGMTPLQMAVLLGHSDMVRYLLDVTDDDQLTDQDRISILIGSIDTDLFDIAKDMLAKHPRLAVYRDGKQETPLHALARKPVRTTEHHGQSIWRTLWELGSRQAQCKVPQHQLELELVQNLWSEVIKQEEKSISKLIGYPFRLLFVAAEYGKVDFLVTLIRSYPDLVWKVDEQNRSIFHIAVIYRHEEIFKLIHELGAIKDLIAIDKDREMNNMLHLAGELAPSHRLNCTNRAALQMQRELLWFRAVEKIVRPEYAGALNINFKTPHALFTEKHEGLRTKGEEWMKKTAESCTFVATLVATVIFAAALTVPGGVDSKGNPVYLEKPLFMVFAIFNAIALFSSCSSILMFLSILISRYTEQDFLRSLPLKLMLGLTGLFVSIATMMIAFTVTFFITFRTGLKWIPIPIALFASVPVALFALQQFPLLLDIYHSTYRSWSLFEPTKPKLFPSYHIHVKKNN